MAAQLYFIALIPNPTLRNQVRSLKQEMKDRFNAKHALKSPAHLTLQMPFRREEKEEARIIKTLGEFAASQNPFTLNLDGFGAFPPRVIFINISNPGPVIQLHKNLKIILTDSLGFEPKDLIDQIHPHMTIATRDLTAAAFQAAWPEFKDRKFSASFTADGLTLLKHNGAQWEIFQEFGFRKNATS